MLLGNSVRSRWQLSSACRAIYTACVTSTQRDDLYFRPSGLWRLSSACRTVLYCLAYVFSYRLFIFFVPSELWRPAHAVLVLPHAVLCMHGRPYYPHRTNTTTTCGESWPTSKQGRAVILLQHCRGAQRAAWFDPKPAPRRRWGVQARNQICLLIGHRTQ